MRYALAWGDKVSPEFRTKVVEICKGFGWKYEYGSWLMACMAFESGETFSPTVKNGAGSGAIGLIQFMPSTAKALGTSVDELRSMTAVEQLEYVRQYFKPFALKIRSLSDMYMAILLPRYIGLDDASVLFENSIAYAQNRGLDLNRDGRVTKAEATHRVAAELERGRAFPAIVDW